MYKLRVVSQTNDGAGIAFLSLLEGGDADFYVKDPKAVDTYKNFPVERVKEWQVGLNKKNDAILFDMVHMGEIADKKRADGYYVYGAGKVQDDLELKRGVGLDVCGDAGLFLPASFDFQDYQKAIEFVESEKELSVVPPHEPIQRWVIKPEGNKSCASTYVAYNKEDTIRNLKRQSKLPKKGECDFILQEVIEGTEVSSELWYVNGKPLVNTYNNTLELKRLMNDEYGPNTGCCSSFVKFNACPKLYTELFEKINPWCLKHKLHGPLDINVIVAKGDHKPYVLELTPRIGYSAWYAWRLGMNMKINDFFYACACGDMTNEEFKPSPDWLGALRVTVPPYPHSDDASKEQGVPVSGIGRFDWNNIVPLDMMQDEDGLCVSGYDGVVCEVCDKDEDLTALWRKIRSREKKLVIANKQIRTDCLENAKKRIEELEKYGYKVG